MNSAVKSTSLETDCGKGPSSEFADPIVRKLSKASSGKAPKSNGFKPAAVQLALNALLYQVPVELDMTMGLLSSPEHEDKKSVG